MQSHYVNFVQGITNSQSSLAATKTPLEMNDFVFYALIENLGMNTITFLNAPTSQKKDHS